MSLAGYGHPLPVGGRVAGWKPRSLIALKSLPRAPVLPRTAAPGQTPQKGVQQALPAQVSGSIMGQISNAARWRRTVEIRYRKKGENYRLVSREIEPYAVRGPYLYGFCLQHQAIHCFLISNIVNAVQTERKFTPRWTVEL